MTKLMARQGDVLIVQVDKLPTETKDIPRDNRGRVVLAEGEVTGHAHAIHDKRVRFMADARGSGQYLDVKERASVVHEEHGAINLPKGFYEIRRQREFDAGEIRRVAD